MKRNHHVISYLAKTNCAKGTDIFGSDELKVLSPGHIIEYWRKRISWPQRDDSINHEEIGHRHVLKVASNYSHFNYLMSIEIFSWFFCFSHQQLSKKIKTANLLWLILEMAMDSFHWKSASQNIRSIWSNSSSPTFMRCRISPNWLLKLEPKFKTIVNMKSWKNLTVCKGNKNNLILVISSSQSIYCVWLCYLKSDCYNDPIDPKQVSLKFGMIVCFSTGVKESSKVDEAKPPTIFRK